MSPFYITLTYTGMTISYNMILMIQGEQSDNIYTSIDLGTGKFSIHAYVSWEYENLILTFLSHSPIAQ